MNSTRLIFALLCLSLCSLQAQENSGVDSMPAPEAPPVAEAPAVTPDAPPAPEPAEPEEAVIPSAYDASRYESSWGKNPFNLKTTPISQPTVAANWSQDWALAGMFRYKDKIRISIRNKQTNEFKSVTNDPNATQEFKLLETKFDRNRANAMVKLEKDGQTGELRFDDASGSAVTINNTMGGGVPGQPGVPPGVNPNQQAISARPVMPNVTTRTPLPGQPPQVIPQPMPGRPGIPPNQNGGIMPPGSIPQQPGVNPGRPPISRRRQLIPAPMIPPPTP
jgi:hypothetical protein